MTKADALAPAHEERSHSILSPSAAHRWMKCPAAALLAAERPDEMSDAALQGTAAHEAAEMVLIGKEPPDRIEVAGRQFPYDEEMQSAVSQYVRAIDSVRRARGDITFEEVELRLILPEIHDELFGTADYVMISERDGRRYLDVFDFKYGFNEVEAAKNPQLLIYALAALPKTDAYEFVVTMHIVQPRLPAGGDVHKYATVSGKALRGWGERRLKPCAEAAMQPNAERHAGSWCKWCKAAVDCDPYRSHLYQESGVSFEAVLKERMPDPDTLTPEQLGKLVRIAPLFKSYCEQAAGRAKRMLEQGHDVPGLKLVAGNRTRKWDDEKVHSSGLPHTVLYREARRSVKQAEDFVKAHDLNIDLSQYYTVDKGVRLVPVEDRRKALPGGFKPIGE